MSLAQPLACAMVALVLFAGCGGEEEPQGGDTQPLPATEAPEPAAPEPAGPPPSADHGDRDRRARLARSKGEPLVETVTRNLETPWELAFLPDGRALLTERPGRVRLLSRSLEARKEPAAEVDVAAIGEGGLLGLAVDPSFEGNRLVYLYRTTDSGNEVVRYRLVGERLREEGTVVDGIDAGAIHNGGRIHFGPDGLLYVATGEAGNAPLAQDRESRNGKILRVRGFRGRRPAVEIVSLGHRNVQGFDWQPGTRRLFATEFGPDSDDEVNAIRPGRNYGWPRAQGTEGGRGLTAALVEYEQVIAPSGGTFVSLPGSAWTGDFVFACLVGEQLRRVGLEGGRVTTDVPLFEGEFGRLRTVVEGPDGALYALTNNTDGRGSPGDEDDRILRITPPTA